MNDTNWTCIFLKRMFCKFSVCQKPTKWDVWNTAYKKNFAMILNYFFFHDFYQQEKSINTFYCRLRNHLFFFSFLMFSNVQCDVKQFIACLKLRNYHWNYFFFFLEVVLHCGKTIQDSSWDSKENVSRHEWT